MTPGPALSPTEGPRSPTRPRRLAIVLSHPTQYYSPWFRSLTQETALIIRVFYLWNFGVTAQHDAQFARTFQWDVDLLSGYAHEFVPNVAADPGAHHFGGLRNPTLTERLTAWRPDVLLLFGYKYASHLRSLFWARRRGVPVLFRGDSHFLGRGLPRPLVRCTLRFVYRQFAGFLPVGAANRDYFTALGVPPARLYFAPHSVNTALFDPGSATHQTARSALRARLQLPPGTRVVLYAGKLIAAKQPRALLEAFIGLNPKKAVLVFIGDGPEKATLQEIARTAPATQVHFFPFANQSEMPSRLLLADVFVLPSRGHYETWGLAVNEAMHMGVPALVSDRVGCQRDLVTEGETGWVFPAEEPEQLREKLATALAAVETDEGRSRLRESVLARIAGYTYAQTTQGLRAALLALAGSARR